MPIEELTREKVQRVRTLAQNAYTAHDPCLYYDEIIGVLANVEDQRVDGIRRLANGGKSLISKKFAAPHIEDRAAELLREFS